MLECEERAGLPTSGALDLLESGPITLGRLADHLNGA
jgi:hypothetical protein